MRRTLFNDNWTFSEGAATTLDMLFSVTAGAPEVKTHPVTLPHDAMIETERKDFYAGACTGFYKPKNVYYTKEYSLKPEDEGKAVWLEFEGIFQFGYVHVNDMLVGRCMYGYGNYYLDITKYVEFDKPNTLKVTVKNEVESSRWYSGGGIYRNVHLLMGNPMHIKCEGTQVTPMEMDSDAALIETVTPVQYTGAGTKKIYVKNELFDRDGKLAGCEQTPLTVTEAGEKEVRQKINVSAPVLWDLENPYLYTCKTTLICGEEVLDEAETTFGIRKFQLDAVHGLRLNGKSIKLKGGCLHHDNGVVGTATFKESEERRIRKLKAAGYNAIRSAAKPISRELLEICDREGILVYDELSDVWTVSKVAFDYAAVFEDNWEQDLTNMIRRDYNHPCVVLYSIGNEIQELTNLNGYKWSEILAEKVRELDKTRFVTMSMNPIMCILDHMGEIMEEAAKAAAAGVDMEELSTPAAALAPDNGDGPKEINSTMNQLSDGAGMLWQLPTVSSYTEESCSHVDIVGLNYATDLYEPDHGRFPNRVMFGSETYPRYLAKNWEIIEKNPYIIGDFCWSAWDYLGESGIGGIDHKDEPRGQLDFYGNWPWKTAYVGVFDLIGDPMPISFWRELVWKNRTAPYISVRPPEFYGKNTNGGNWCWISDSISSWNWAGYEGKPIEVEVYTRAESVELFVNGKSVGVQKTGEIMQYVALFDTIYEPGEVKAVASDGETFILQSAANENVIRAYVDPVELAQPEREITNIELSICDEAGVLNPSSAKKIQIEIEGDGVIQGFGSADPLSTENFFDQEIAAFHGRALAVIRHNKTYDPVKVKFTAEGCGAVEIKL